MKAQVLQPPAVAVVAATVTSPAVPPVVLVKTSRRVEAIVESVLFYGVLGVGLSSPLLGAAYALLFR